MRKIYLRLITRLLKKFDRDCRLDKQEDIIWGVIYGEEYLKRKVRNLEIKEGGTIFQ